MSGPSRWRKKPVVIEAIQWDGENVDEMDAFIGRAGWHTVDEDDRGDDPEITAAVMDKLHSTWVGFRAGQWVIRGVQGEFYPCDADVFAATYEPAGDDDGSAG